MKGFTSERGFTVIELIVTVAIIATLATIGLISYQGVRLNNRDQIRSRDLASLKQALELYRHDKHHYPATLNELVPQHSNSIPVDPNNPDRIYYYKAYNSDQTVCTPSSVSCVKYMLCAATEGSKSMGDPGNCDTISCGTVDCNMSIINE